MIGRCIRSDVWKGRIKLFLEVQVLAFDGRTCQVNACQVVRKLMESYDIAVANGSVEPGGTL